MTHATAKYPRAVLLPICLIVLALGTSGCTSLPEYLHNGFKVGPNFKLWPAPVGADWIKGKDWPDADKDWIDNTDKRARRDCDDQSKWWSVFEDPVLDQLICIAYQQNLTVREAAYRVLQARYQLLISAGNLLPQTQTMTGDVIRKNISSETVNSSFVREQYFGQVDLGFNLSWELDFWGRLRRAIESNRANLDASVHGYDDVLVTLLGDIASNYVVLRTTEQRIRYAQENVAIQRRTLKIAEAQFKAGAVGELDVDQAKTLLFQTEAGIPALEITLRQATNQLCLLLGIPPEDLRHKLGPAPIPKAPAEVAVGLPADLLRRRPDIRRAQSLAAAQSAQIGIAEAEFYPHIFLNGNIGWSAGQFRQIFDPAAQVGSFGPSFQWNLLNYGRILNNVRYQDARFQELMTAYQQTVLNAQKEVENGLVAFLKSQQQTHLQEQSVKYAEKSVKVVVAQYEGGLVDLTRVTQLQQILVQQQDVLAQAKGNIALGLIQTYRALGGGWEIRLTGCDPELRAPAAERIPPPRPAPDPAKVKAQR